MLEHVLVIERVFAGAARLFGLYPAIFIAGIAGVFALSWGYYFYWRLRPAEDYQGDTPDADENRRLYNAWRDGLSSSRGGRYDALLDGALNWSDRFFGGDTSANAARRSYWSGASLDRCFLIAVIYPIITLITLWHITGAANVAESALGFSLDASPEARATSAVSLAAVIISFYWLLYPSASQKSFIWRVMRAGTFVFAFAFAGTFAGVSAVAFAVAFAVAGAAAGAGAAAVAIAGAVAVAVAVAGAGAFAFAFAFAGAFAVAIAVAVAWFTDDGRRWKLLSFSLVYLAASLSFVWFAPRLVSSSGWNFTLLLFLIGLPIINAIFDWISIGVTRGMLRKGQKEKSFWPFILAAADLIIATILLVALLGFSLAYIEAMNIAAAANGAPPVFDVPATLADLRNKSLDPSLYWIYVTIFTTFIPSLVNLTLGGLAVVRGIPGLNAQVASRVLPEDPQRLIFFRRIRASLFLALQITVAFLGAFILGGLVLAVLLEGMQVIGLGLLNVAEFAYGSVEAVGENFNLGNSASPAEPQQTPVSDGYPNQGDQPNGQTPN